MNSLRTSIVMGLVLVTHVLSAYIPVKAALVVEAGSGEIIYSYNENQRTQPASLTKMMTLLLTFRALQQKKITPQTLITMSPRAASQSPCKLGLKAGSQITVRDAIMSLITKSANDIAVALAERLGGTERNFVRQMNAEATRLGMSSTVFTNPSGWKDIRQQSTARDMSILARALLREYPGYYHLFSTKHFRYKGMRLKNHNNLLGKRYSYVVDGIKTGYVAASGFNLAASAVKGKTRLIAVVLGGKNAGERDALTSLLLKKGFARFANRRLIRKTLASNTKKNMCVAYVKNQKKLSSKQSGEIDVRS